MKAFFNCILHSFKILFVHLSCLSLPLSLFPPFLTLLPFQLLPFCFLLTSFFQRIYLESLHYLCFLCFLPRHVISYHMTLLNRMGEASDSNLVCDRGFTLYFSVSPRIFQSSTLITSRLFPSKSFQFITHLSSYHMTSCSLATNSVVK
jgi:hypothetical protein